MTDDEPDFMAIFRAVIKLKAKMKERDMTRARTTCPACGEPNLWAVLAKNGHIHVVCQTPKCNVVVME